MSNKLQMNQFSQTPLKGAVAALLSDLTLSCQVDPDSVATLVAGTKVKLTDEVANTIVIDAALAADEGVGFVLYTPKKDSFTAGDPVEIGFSLTIMWGEAGGTISRGNQLESVATGAKLVANTGNPVCGVALDNASNGDIFRYMVLMPYSIPATITSGSINGVAIGGSTPAAGTFTTLTSTGTTTLGDAAGDSIVITGIVDLTGSTIKGASPLVFEGATADAFEGTLAVADFSADQTFTIPDATGTFDLHHQTPLVITPSATPAYAPGASRDLATLVPDQSGTIAATTTGALVGKTYRIKILTSGTSSFTLTFGSNFKTTGTLATGTSDAKTFIMTFVFDGTNFVEAGRTTAM